ncbi:GTP-binding protein [uncultured Prochlorococcus sp.]|uniref:GTP-binding protein n=1 Tax=uncultured Prochlorococcus sp. TaxID=159733 RepID=UPI00258F0930|nr:GTP-binding protein [uncultured Prochlorococcus sp.]
MKKKIPVIVVSGFLGSGKTTFLRYLLKESKKKFGLIINEFGDVGIDGDLIKSCEKCDESEDECVIELNNGCLCCTVQDDFVPSIKAVLEFDPPIESIIIETSGLALPIPLIQALNWPEIRSSIYLDVVVGIVNGESMLKGSPINDLGKIINQYNKTDKIDHNASIDELFEEQLEVSDIVLVSRSDILNNEQFEYVKNKIQGSLNPSVPVLKSKNGKIDLNYLFNFSLKKESYKEYLSEEHDHNHVELISDSIKFNCFLEKNEFEKEISKILDELNILRIKGRMWIPNKQLPLQIQIVGKKINTWFEDAPVNCWRPNDNAGIELVIFAFDEKSIKIFNKKIKEKFKILSNPKIRI